MSNLVQGNTVGLGADGRPLGNRQAGVFVRASFNTIGGTAEGARNVVSGNGFHGIWVAGADTLVQRNIVGLTPNGAEIMANAAAGIWVESAGNTLRGNTSSGNIGDNIGLSGTGATGNL